MRSRFDRRAPELALVGLLLATALVVMPALAIGQGSEPGLVTGTISTAEPLSPSANAVAVVTIVDRSAGGGDVIVGQQRRADPGPTPIKFKVAYDPARIQGGHAYVIFAAILDGGAAWQNSDGVPVITGGPTSGVNVGVKRVPGSSPMEVLGQISKDDKSSLTGKAVALAALQDTATGRIDRLDGHLADGPGAHRLPPRVRPRQRGRRRVAGRLGRHRRRHQRLAEPRDATARGRRRPAERRRHHRLRGGRRAPAAQAHADTGADAATTHPGTDA